MNNGKFYIVHLGSLGFPYAFNASTNRCKAIYSILSPDRFDILVINNRTISENNLSSFEIKHEGSFNGIKFIFTTLNVLKPINFFKRRLNNVIGRFNEIFLLIKKGFRNEIDILLFYPTGSFFDLVLYRIFSISFSVPIVIHYVEFRSGFHSRGSLLKLNDRLFDRFLTSFCEGVIPISEFLVNKVREKSKKMPILKIPPIIDFEKFQKVKFDKINQKYFLFVGSAGYFNTIKFIIDAFNRIKDNNYNLILIINGLNEKITDLFKSSNKSSLIRCLSKLNDEELINYYNNAVALLIPLANTIQDQARFPQKISEYLASKNPVITSKVGDINYYLEDEKDALIALPDDVNSFSEKMKWVIENPSEAKAIGYSGYEKGVQYFNTLSYKTQINSFILDIINH